MIYRLITLFALCFSFSFSYSQNVPGMYDVNSFSLLNEQRLKLNTLIPNLEAQIAGIPIGYDTLSIIQGIRQNEARIHWYEEQLKNPNLSDTTKQNYKLEIEAAKSRVIENNNYLKINKTEKTLKLNLQKSLDSAIVVRSTIEIKINQLMIPRLSQQNFMFWASIAFLLLMCFLLMIFFYVIYIDENVRKIIFGSDSGLQFITIFCIVIAIILFGLTGVLEDKELSALLGSVAGYILGKVKISNTNNSDNGNP